MTTALVVENSLNDRQLAGGLLKRHGLMAVRFASNGNEALSLIEREHPELVVADLDGIKMDGLDLVTTIKQKYPEVPIVLMTSKGDEDVAFRALEHGAASYVPRRRLAHDLVSTVERVLAASKQPGADPRLMASLRRTETSFELRNDPELIRTFVHSVQQDLAILNLCDATDRMRVRIALEEALLNAMYHGNLEVWAELKVVNRKAYLEMARQRARQFPYCDRRIFVDVHLTRREAIIVIRDEGPGFDVRRMPDPPDAASLHRRLGRGLLLMQIFMDLVAFNAKGNEVTLVKRARNVNV